MRVGGQGHLITERDVRAAASGGDVGARREKVRRAVAQRTSAAWRSIPHFYLRLDADVSAALKLHRPTELVCAAAIEALRRHPECNLAWAGDRLETRSSIDVGILVDTPDGLLLPAVRAADGLSFAELASALRDAVERAHRSVLAASDSGPRSITVSNLGMHAVDGFAGVIAMPDVLLLAVGRVVERPAWDGASWQPRKVMPLTLSVDHRALDGASAARLLTTLEAMLADPEVLLP
jgi:pyruvate dehydrogenase E2 component (dihydrolipoamide acetyltransferase)